MTKKNYDSHRLVIELTLRINILTDIIINDIFELIEEHYGKDYNILDLYHILFFVGHHKRIELFFF